MNKPGAGIIFYHVGADNKYYILIGQESVYMTDVVKNADFKRKQIYSPAASSMAASSAVASPTNDWAYYHFFETAKKISAPTGAASPIIRFDTPHAHTGRNSGLPIFTTHMRYLPPDAKWGIIKGRSNKNEAPHNTILREFEEEVGYKLDIDGIDYFTTLKNDTFFVSST